MQINFKRPIFIVGCTNSGTKCLFNSLMEHPELGGFKKELHFYGFGANLDGRINRLFSLWPCFKTNYLNDTKATSFDNGPIDKEAVQRILSVLWEHPDEEVKEGQRLLIKEPKFSLRIKWLQKIFPDCYIIAIVRNPWSVIEGLKRRIQALGDVPLNLDTPTAAAQWNITNNVIQMDGAGGENFQWVKYEDMIQADAFPIKLKSNCFWSRLLHHAGLPIDSFTIPNESKYSNFEQGKDEESIKNLTTWDIDYINIACKHLIDKFNYPKPVREKCPTEMVLKTAAR